ncbi:hypothetical protein MRX96_011586 [Rhipicephalus microplus]
MEHIDSEWTVTANSRASMPQSRPQTIGRDRGTTSPRRPAGHPVRNVFHPSPLRPFGRAATRKVVRVDVDYGGYGKHGGEGIAVESGRLAILALRERIPGHVIAHRVCSTNRGKQQRRRHNMRPSTLLSLCVFVMLTLLATQARPAHGALILPLVIYKKLP